MAVNKEQMIEWLSELPDDADIGIEVAQRGELNLVAFSGEDEYRLIVGGIPEDRKKANPQANGHK